MSEGQASKLSGASGPPLVSQALLLSVAEELKLPLLQIARQTEQAQLGGAVDLEGLRTTADTALRLIDNYALSVRLQLDAEQFTIEPVSVSSVLYDTGQQLSSLAKSYGVELELNIAGKYGTVMANRHGLQSALVSLGAALIEALPALDSPQLKLQLATHRSRYGIVAGLYSQNPRLSNEALQRGRRLQTRSRQPLIGLSHTSAAGVFVADAILRAMQLRLRTSRHQHQYGLGTVLQPNKQMALM